MTAPKRSSSASPAARSRPSSATTATSWQSKVVIDAANKFGNGPMHSAAEFATLAPAAHYARTFNYLGWRTSPNPITKASRPTSSTPPTSPPAKPSNTSSVTSASTPSTSAPASDLLDQLFKLWFTLVNTQGRGRHLALKVL